MRPTEHQLSTNERYGPLPVRLLQALQAIATNRAPPSVVCHLLSLLLLDIISRRVFPGTLPISIDGPYGSSVAHRLDIFDVLPVDHVSSCDKRTSYVPCLRLLLTVWADRLTIDILPDDVLLHIFLFDRSWDRRWHLNWRWHRLVHVCQRWRSVVFAYPNFLDLRLVCDTTRRVGLTSIWPPVPIIIKDMDACGLPRDYDFDAAIVHYSRVCELSLLSLSSSQLQRLTSAMQKRFPALTRLVLGSRGSSPTSALPDGFLGGSAPRLQSLELDSVSFPALPNLLLSSTDLVRLTLWNIPDSGYIPPEAIVTGLAVLANLKYLTIKFGSSRSLSDREGRRPLPETRIVLPALIRFQFQGDSEYLEDLVARIDAPFIDYIWITFFYQPFFNIPQLAQFMRRPTRFGTHNEVHANFDHYGVLVKSLSSTRTHDEKSVLRIICGEQSRELNEQLLSLAQVYKSFFPSNYRVKHLYVTSQYLPSQLHNIEDIQWPEFFHLFTAVKNLYLCKEFAKCVALSLQRDAGERVTDMLPALESLSLEGLRPWGAARRAI